MREVQCLPLKTTSMKESGFELVHTQFFDPDALRLPSYTVGRIDYGTGRSYLKIVDGQLEEPFRLYTSLTTAINTCAPMERGLLEWYCKLGLAEAERYVKQAMHYGTLMHLVIGQYLIDGVLDFDALYDKVQSYCKEKDYWEREVEMWPTKLKYDLAAFIQFEQDYNIKPLGIEYVLVSKRGFGTLIDLVCEMDVEEKGFYGEVYKSGPRKGEPKETSQTRRIRGIVNFKSGRHGFGRNNGIQVEAERLLFEENFPDLKIDRAYNWSPKEWETVPGYNLRDWSDEIDPGEIDAILQLAQIRFGDRALRKSYIKIGGLLERGKTSLTDCVRNIKAEEYAKERYGSTPTEFTDLEDLQVSE
jgi:hypothetical protein